MHINGYLGPNILNPSWDAPHEELNPADLAKYERFARTGDCYEVLYAIASRLLLSPLRPEKEDEFWHYGPRVDVDQKFCIEVLQGKAERVMFEYGAPVRLRALDKNDQGREVVAHHIYPKYTLENTDPPQVLQELRVILPDEAIGLSVDLQAAFRGYESDV